MADIKCLFWGLVVIFMWPLSLQAAEQKGMRLEHANGNACIAVDGKETPAIIATPCGSRFNTNGNRLNLVSPGKYYVTQLGTFIPKHEDLSICIDVLHEHSILEYGHTTLKLVETMGNPAMPTYYVSLKAVPGQPVSRIEGIYYSNSNQKGTKLFNVPFKGRLNQPIKLSADIHERKLIIKADDMVLYTRAGISFVPNVLYVSTYAAAGSFDNLNITTNGKTVIKDSFDGSTSETLRAKWNFQEIMPPNINVMNVIRPGWNFPLNFSPASNMAFSSVGIHLYTSDSMDMASAWREADKFDFSGFDNELRGILTQDPQAKLLVRLRIDPPEWWLEQNPGHWAIAIDRNTGKMDKSKLNLASFASEKWRKDSQKAIERFIEHLNSIPEGDRVIGVNVACGCSLEWTYSFTPDFYDYSPAGLQGFRTWLKNKYKTDAALRQAWKRTDITFGTVTIPTPDQRKAGKMGDFLDPVNARNVIDFNRFHSDSIADCLIGYAKTVKEKSKGRLFTVAFYGYHFNQNPGIGHDSLSRVLRSEYMDSVACPHYYDDRGVGGSTIGYIPIKSVFLNNKIWFLEDDTRTFLSWSGAAYGRASTPSETVGVMKRNFAYTFSYSGGIWYLEWHRGWMNHESIVNVVGDFKKISEAVLPASRQRNTQICVVVSEQSKDYLRFETGLRENLFVNQYFLMIPRIGAPYDVVLIDDLEKAPDYRMYILLDTFYMNKHQREVINSKCKKNGQTVIWIHAAGYITDDGYSAEAMSDMIGMKITSSNKISRQKLTIFQLGYKTFETSGEFGPVLVTEDPDVKKLGLVNAAGNLQGCGFAEKQFENWKSVWTAVPTLPASILRDYAKQAGVNIYSDRDDWVAAADFMIAVHASNDGVRKIKLPRNMTIYDPFTSKIIVENANLIKINMKKGETFFGLVR